MPSLSRTTSRVLQWSWTVLQRGRNILWEYPSRDPSGATIRPWSCWRAVGGVGMLVCLGWLDWIVVAVMVMFGEVWERTYG